MKSYPPKRGCHLHQKRPHVRVRCTLLISSSQWADHEPLFIYDLLFSASDCSFGGCIVFPPTEFTRNCHNPQKKSLRQERERTPQEEVNPPSWEKANPKWRKKNNPLKEKIGLGGKQNMWKKARIWSCAVNIVIFSGSKQGGEGDAGSLGFWEKYCAYSQKSFSDQKKYFSDWWKYF